MTRKNVWKDVDTYVEDKIIPKDAILEANLNRNRQANLPEIDVSPTQGKLLHLLAKMNRSTSILEVGTLGGYSTIWLARSLPENGQLLSLELEEAHAEVARENINVAGLESKVTVLVGKAAELLPTLETMGYGPFDFIFIDADKQNYPTYFEWALKLAADGAVIIGDNVVRNGEVINKSSDDNRVHGVRHFMDLLQQSDEIDATAIQTVGSKGYDGFVLGIVNKKNNE